MKAKLREVGTLWIGGELSWMEQLCLKSFVDQGQKITLFSYDDIPNVPEGVIRRDGREVLDTDNFLKYEKKDSFALFADLFRLHMLAKNPGMIWVDTDVYCLRPMTYDTPDVLGFELPGGQRVNNAVLGLAPDSPLLAAMLDYTADPFAVPPFVRPKLRDEFAQAAAEGQPVHVSQQPWGVWGPMMVTHFVHHLELAAKVLPQEAFYPIAFPDRQRFFKPVAEVEAMLSPQTTALHLWASNKRELGMRYMGLPPKGSYLDMLVKRHAISPNAAPIKRRGNRIFDAGLVDHVGLEEVRLFTDIGGTAQSLAIAAHGKWDCDIQLVDIDYRGRFSQKPSKWVAPYTKALSSQGVDPARIKRVGAEDALRPAQLIANLNGFGDINKIKHLETVLPRLLDRGSQLILDVRKGSGAFPFLKDFGTTNTVSTTDVDGVPVVRTILTADKVSARDDEASWSAIAATLAGTDGFFRESREHSFLFTPRSDTLVVTFDNVELAMEKRDDRRPWGYSFIEKQGWSMLGVMANGWTWYRDPWVAAQFDELRESGFFARFRRVVFYGASMGGYAAAAFVAACPGADAVIISPQSTLDRSVVPWETRYKTAWDRDFSGPYGDAATASHAAGTVTLLYDPYEELDAAHAARFTGPNVLKLRSPLLGHRLGSSLQQMGILAPVTLGALNGTLTEGEFYSLLRQRKTFSRYQKELFDRALAMGRPALARRVGRWVLTRGDNRHIRREMLALDQAAAAPKAVPA